VAVGVLFHIFLVIYKLCAPRLFHDSFTITYASTNQREAKRQREREKYAYASTNQREAKRQREGEKYASMWKIYYQQKKAEKEGARNNTKNIGIIFFQN